jgi:hypothetical protein
MILRLAILALALATPMLAPFSPVLAHCPAPFAPSLAARLIATREGFYRPGSIPSRFHNPCAIHPRSYLRFPDPESGWRRCEEKLIEMSESRIKAAWNLGDDKLSLRILVAVRRMKAGL